MAAQVDIEVAAAFGAGGRIAIRVAFAVQQVEQQQPWQTAADLVNKLSERELADLIYQYGEERDSRKIARAIIKARPLHTTRELVSVIEAVSPRRRSFDRLRSLHPATRTFQALRIAVNEELASIEVVLPQAVSALRPGGRLALISFHSLEDRIVKDFFREQSRDLVNPPYEQIYDVERRATLKEVNRKPNFCPRTMRPKTIRERAVRNFALQRKFS